MIENYVEWFCVFINVPYERNETLESWIINRKQNKEFEIGNVSVLQNNTKQLSLCDFDIDMFIIINLFYSVYIIGAFFIQKFSK
ncbi:hypothetical protein ACA971_14025 [Staphylococcus aureus]|nr:hypothetical protein [Staphylococcus aureus]CAC6481870.1 Uncharacterised protein [Staphylococcus aureus]